MTSSPTSRPLVAGRTKARGTWRFASSTSIRSDCCQCWFETQPAGRSPRGERRSRCAVRRYRGGRGTGLRAPGPAAIPIAALHPSPIPPTRRSATPPRGSSRASFGSGRWFHSRPGYVQPVQHRFGVDWCARRDSTAGVSVQWELPGVLRRPRPGFPCRGCLSVPWSRSPPLPFGRASGRRRSARPRMRSSRGARACPRACRGRAASSSGP